MRLFSIQSTDCSSTIPDKRIIQLSQADIASASESTPQVLPCCSLRAGLRICKPEAHICGFDLWCETLCLVQEHDMEELAARSQQFWLPLERAGGQQLGQLLVSLLFTKVRGCREEG